MIALRPSRMPSPPLLIATDLDTIPLAADTYGLLLARPALDALVRSGALVVLASRRTRPEVRRLARMLAMRAPLIVEGGGGVLFPTRLLGQRVPGSRRSGGYESVRLGVSRRTLLAALPAIAATTGATLRGFSSLPVAEIEKVTGLTRSEIRLARCREWDEPFLVEAGDAERVAAAASRRGLRVTRGDRFWRLAGAADKGAALGLVLDLFAAEGRRFASVGLGGAADDLSMLARVDRAILMPRPDGSIDPTLAAALPRAERAPAPGPAGWNAAVLHVLERA
jgi:mannosyl-3-phosphoglycerate phosphatase